MKTRLGTIEFEPVDDAKTIVITLKSKEIISVEHTIEFLRCLIQEMHKYVEKKKKEDGMH